MQVSVSWKFFARLDDPVPSILAGQGLPFFRSLTGKSILREMGGNVVPSFYPLVLEPTGPFFSKLAAATKKTNIRAKKNSLSFEVDVLREKIDVSAEFSIHLYGQFVCIDLTSSSLKVAGGQAALKCLRDVQLNSAVDLFIKGLFSIVAQGVGGCIENGFTPKVYPCLQITSVSREDDLPSGFLIELLTRHTSPHRNVIDDVYAKNSDHQIDGTLTLLDRQGIVCYVPSTSHSDEKRSNDRRFRSCSAMLELAAAAQRLSLDSATSKNFFSDIEELVLMPDRVIQNSTSSLRAWILILKEFGLRSNLFDEARKRFLIGDIKDQSMVADKPFTTVESLPRENRRSVLCIAAATVELSAVVEFLDSKFGKAQIVPLDEGMDYAFKYFDKSSGACWYVVSLSFQGETEAAVSVKHLCLTLKPSLAIMLGMCMGMPKKKLPTGAVIIPNEVSVFDHQRRTVEGTQYRPHGDRVDNGLFKLSKLLSVQKNNFEFPVITDKALASATAKVEDPSTDLIKFIENSFPDASAFDMEGWGFYRGAAGLDCVWIKAVADSGETQVLDFSDQENKRTVQRNVTGNAVEFGVFLVERYFQARQLSS